MGSEVGSWIWTLQVGFIGTERDIWNCSLECRMYLLLHGLAAQANDWGATIAFCCPPRLTEGHAAVLQVFSTQISAHLGSFHDIRHVRPWLSTKQTLMRRPTQAGFRYPRQMINIRIYKLYDINIFQEILPPNWRAIYECSRRFTFDGGSDV